MPARLLKFPVPAAQWVERRNSASGFGPQTGQQRAKGIPFRVDALEALLYAVALSVGAFALLVDRDIAFAANTVVPVALILALGWGCVRMAVQQVETILTPTFAMRLAILFYGGIGSLIPLYANDETKNFIDSFFQFTQDELLKYNIILILFTICFSYTPALFRSIFTRFFLASAESRSNFGIEESSFPLPVVASFFLLVGAIAKYFVILPFQFGLISGTFPLFIAQFALLENIGIFLILVWAQRYRPFFIPFIFAYGVFTVIIAVLTFSKINIIFPVMMMSAAVVYVRPNLFRITASVAAILFVFNVVQPIANHGRAWISRTSAAISAPVGLGERIDIVRAYFDGGALTDDDQINYALVRFSYANVGTFLVSARDSGWEGDTLKYIGALVIPRFLWPEKPVLTDIANELNEAITGNIYSAVAPGFAAEGYWDGGWLGVVLMALTVGLVCYLWSLYALEVQRMGAWHLFVIVLLGLSSGTRFDGFFVTDLVGPLLYAMLGHVAIVLLNRIIAIRR